jgi:type I restriction enzyme S subunit
MEVKPGYKQAEVGVIPEEWDADKLGNFVSLRRGHDLTWRDRRPGDVPVMGSAGQNGFHDKALAKGPGVVLGRSGASFGQAHYCEKDFWPHNTALYVTDFRGNDPLFVFYFLKSIDFTRHNTGGAQQSLNRNFIYPVPVGVPRPPEQRAIAGALSDVDALIGALDQLIAKKRDLKQAAMQQLLTGQKRLPGFGVGSRFTQTDVGLIPEDWRLEAVGEISLVGRGRVISHREIAVAMSPLYPVYSSQTSNNGIMGYLDTFDFEGEYITWTTDGANAGTVFHRNGRFNCTNVCGTIKVKRDNAVFVSKVLAGIAPRHVSRNLGNPKLMNDVMKRILVPLPPSVAEQTAIAEVLSDMDAELAALEQRRDKTRALKQGMMQELLTGRTRLVDKRRGDE